jgi:Protein of unknown function (DUF2510)
MSGTQKFAGVKLTDTEVTYKREGGPIAGAVAHVETAGEVDRRITATRLLLAGPFALAMRKKKDARELYLTVEGDGFAFVVELDPKDGAEARRFSAKITTAGSRAAKTAMVSAPPPPASPPPPAVPAGWNTDPTARHQLRYWDGQQWSEHVSDNGSQAVDPMP